MTPLRKCKSSIEKRCGSPSWRGNLQQNRNEYLSERHVDDFADAREQSCSYTSMSNMIPHVLAGGSCSVETSRSSARQPGSRKKEKRALRVFKTDSFLFESSPSKLEAQHRYLYEQEKLPSDTSRFDFSEFKKRDHRKSVSVKESCKNYCTNTFFFGSAIESPVTNIEIFQNASNQKVVNHSDKISSSSQTDTNATEIDFLDAFFQEVSKSSSLVTTSVDRGRSRSPVQTSSSESLDTTEIRTTVSSAKDKSKSLRRHENAESGSVGSRRRSVSFHSPRKS